MGNKTKVQPDNCAYCGRFFKPDKRVGARQNSCQDKKCQKKRKKDSQKKWVEANPGYFRGRYSNTKEWRKRNPDYQRQWRAKRREIQDEIPSKKPIKTLRLVVPDKWLKGEIQDEIRLVRQCGCGFFVAGKGMRDTRRDCIV